MLRRTATSLAAASALLILCGAKGPGGCQRYVPERDFLVFVGERLSVTKQEPSPVPQNVIVFDEQFQARYKVLDVVFGSYPKDQITFTAYDHYGYPKFAKYDTALLFVSRSPDGEYIHEKYEFFPVYPTKNGRWASCGDPYRFDPERPHEIKPEKIDFAAAVTDDGHPCTQGNYVEDLFRIKKEGVLKARGLFK